jgi:hypothetical protein
MKFRTWLIHHKVFNPLVANGFSRKDRHEWKCLHLEGMVGSKTFQTGSRCWLWWNIFVRRDAKVYMYPPINCCPFWLWNLAGGCQSDFPHKNLSEDAHMMHPKGFVDPKNIRKYAYFISLFMDWSKHLRVGIFVLMKKSKGLASSRKEPCVYKKASGSNMYFCSICRWHIVGQK